MDSSAMYLTESQVSVLTGFSRSSLQQHRWLGKGIPFIRVGRTIRYEKTEIQAYLEKFRVQTKPL